MFFIFYTIGNANISALGCQTLAALVLRQPAHCSVVIENNGHHVILQAMKVHSTAEQVQVSLACLCVIEKRVFSNKSQMHFTDFLYDTRFIFSNI